MANKILRTKIALLHKSYSEWDAIKASYIPLKGEVCICEVPASSGAVVQEPAVLFKVGDGVKSFGQLPWASALAADIYSWAKKENLEFSDLTENFKNALKEFIGAGTGNTQYRIVADGDYAWKLQKSDDGETWTDADGRIDVSTKIAEIDSALETVNTEIDEVSSDVTELGTTVEGVSTTVTNLDTKVTNIDTKVTGLDTNVTNLSTTVGELNTKVNELDTTVTELSTDVTGLSTKVDDVSTDVTELDTAVTNLNTDVTEINDDVTEINDDVTEINTALANKTTQTVETSLGNSVIINETTGGSVKFDRKDGKKALISTKDFSDAKGVGVQLYAIDVNNNEAGPRIQLTLDRATYSKNTTEVDAGHELLVKNDLVATSIAYDPAGTTMTSNDIQAAIQETWAAIGSGGTVAVVNVTKKEPAETGYAATYEVSQGGQKVGVSINIPKDFLVRSGEVKTVVESDRPYAGAEVGDKYIDLVINTKDASAQSEHVYVPVNDLVDVYTGGKGINVENNTITFNATTIDNGTIPQAKIENLTTDIQALEDKDTELETTINAYGTAVTKNYATQAIGADGEDVGALPTVEQVKTYVLNKVSGSMHFQGIFDTLPAASSYNSGDVVIINIKEDEQVVGRKEYVCVDLGVLGKAWEELGDEQGLYATTVQLSAVKGAGWTNETVKGNADDIKVLDTSTENLESTVGNTSDPLTAGTVLYRLNTLESKPAYNITSTDVSNWNAKQDAIADSSAEIASVTNDVVTLHNVNQTSGVISKGAANIELAKVAKTGAASDIIEDTTHRFVTDADKANWNANNNYVKSVDTSFNVDEDGKLEFASGYQAMTTTQSSKLAGISNSATKVETSAINGNIKIDGAETIVYTLPSDVVEDSEYAHISVTTTAVSDGTHTLKKYEHPEGTGASKPLNLYKISTDGTSHISGATAVTGSDIASYLNFLTAYDATNNKIATAADIAGGVHFKGVYASLEDIDFTPANGDMVIVGTAEYIYNANATPAAWVKLGDENAWDTKGSAAQALADAKSYADGKIESLDSSITAISGKAIGSVEITNGVITDSTMVDIPTVPTNVSSFTNDADYATQSYVNSQIAAAITDAIAASY